MKTKTLFSMAIAFLLALYIPAMMPMHAAGTTFADGDYTVPFTVLKESGNEQSATADYMVSPAKVKIQNDKATVTVTLNNSSWWQYFKVQGKDVQVVSEANDKRVVKFDVTDLRQPVKAKIHVIVTGIPGFEYDNKYDIRLSFNTSSIPAPPAEKPVTTPPVKETKPETKPEATKKPEEKPTQQKVEKPVEKKEVSKNETTVTEKASKSESEKESKTEDASTTDVETDENVDAAKDEEDELGVEDRADELAEEEEAAEEISIEETEQDEAVAEEVADEKGSSNTILFIVLAVIFAILAGGITFAAVKKRARK